MCPVADEADTAKMLGDLWSDEAVRRAREQALAAMPHTAGERSRYLRTCCCCGEEIAQARLAAVPATRFCAGCKAELEGRRR